MSLASDRYASRRETLVFATCILLSVVLRVSPVEWREAAASSIRGTLLAPLLAVQHQAELQKGARARFSAVVSERDSVAQAASSIAMLREENMRLRELLDLEERLGFGHVSAEVLHQTLPTDGLTLVLSAGNDQGVRPLAPVVSPAGLVGLIESVDAKTSVAVIWAHPDFRASAMTLDLAVLGIVAPRGHEGPNTMLMELRGVPYRDRVPPGTKIYTSGVGGVYPRGILIGTVLDVAKEGEGWTRSYVVKPAVHPGSVSHVMILTEPVSEVAGVFAPQIR